MDAITSGVTVFEEIVDALTKERVDRDEAARRLQELDAEPVVTLHPAIAADHRRQAADLQKSLADPNTSPGATSVLRSLIYRIVLPPNPNGREVPKALTVRMERVKGIEPSS